MQSSYMHLLSYTDDERMKVGRLENEWQSKFSSRPISFCNFLIKKKKMLERKINANTKRRQGDVYGLKDNSKEISDLKETLTLIEKVLYDKKLDDEKTMNNNESVLNDALNLAVEHQQIVGSNNSCQSFHDFLVEKREALTKELEQLHQRNSDFLKRCSVLKQLLTTNNALEMLYNHNEQPYNNQNVNYSLDKAQESKQSRFNCK